MTVTTLTPAIIGQAEKHHSAILTAALHGTTVDEKQWIVLNQAIGAGQPVRRSDHIERICTLTRWGRLDVAAAVDRLVENELLLDADDQSITVTDSGHRVSAAVRGRYEMLIRPAYGAVSSDELATAARVLSIITARLSDQLAAA